LNVIAVDITMDLDDLDCIDLTHVSEKVEVL
jgi:hypothetical protein